MQVELSKREIATIIRCLSIERGIWGFRRGFGKESADEKRLGALEKRLAKVLNPLA